MSEQQSPKLRVLPSRREFLRGTAATLATASIARMAHAAGSEELKIALIGCGGRGTGAASQALHTSGPVRLVAMADAFADRIERSLKNLSAIPEIRARIDVPPERRYVGFDAYQKVLASDVDMVLLTTPPHFRPIHYPAAVKAGKQIYMEKPVAVDAPGVQLVLAANVEAQKKGLHVAVGFQRRHEGACREAIRKIRDGQIGPIQFLRTYYLMPGAISGTLRKPDETEMEYQLRRWPYFTWLSGDHFVEQSVHAVDVANWIKDAHPIRAQALGGRQVRIGKGTGQIFDHGCVEFEYADGARYFAFARQIPGCFQHVGQYAHGTKGMLPVGVGLKELSTPGRNAYQLQHDRLFAAIRGNQPFFEADYGATSAMTAIMGRMALYSGKEVTWEVAMQSKMRLAPDRYTLDAAPPAQPDAAGNYPVAVPGATVAW
jgi:predicted dehydrogenase